MKKRISLFTLFFVFIFNSISAQDFDSLEIVWNDKAGDDEQRLEAIDIIAWEKYLFRYPDSGFYYAQIQYDLALQIGNKKQMANALNTQGVSYSMRGQYSKSLDFHARSLEIRLEIGDLYGIAKSYMNMGPVYSNQGDYIHAIDVYQKSLAISEPNNFVKLISTSLNNIGVIYNSQNDYDKALEYFLQGLKLAKESNNRRVEANAISNISLVYRYQGNPDSALAYAYSGLNIFEELGDLKGSANAYESIGMLYYAKKEFNKTITFQLKALKIRESINDKLGLASNMVSLGLAHLKKGLPKQGENWCKKGLEMAISVNSVAYKKDACECLSESSKEQGLWKESLEYYQKLLVELSLFVPFLVFFRFVTILLSPYTSKISNEEPLYQLLLSMVLAVFITPTHRFFERKIRRKIFNKKPPNSVG
jgi:tetratricopeptide (TPR) repeat protein